MSVMVIFSDDISRPIGASEVEKIFDDVCGHALGLPECLGPGARREGFDRMCS